MQPSRPLSRSRPPPPPASAARWPGVAAITERVAVGATAATDQHRAGLLQPQLSRHPAGAEVGAITEPAMAAAATATELVHAGWQVQRNRARRGWSRFSHGTRNHSRRGRAHRWGAPWRRRRCRKARRRCGRVSPVAPCSCTQGRRTSELLVFRGSWSWPLRAQGICIHSGAGGAEVDRLAVLTSKAGGSVHESEATTRAARAETQQTALALGFWAAVGRPTRGALFIGAEFSGAHAARRHGEPIPLSKPLNRPVP